MSRTAVVVFSMAGCPACSEYMPRFNRIARRAADGVPVHVLDAADPRHQALAERLGVSATPATYVLRSPAGAVALIGAAPNADIEQLFQIARAHR